MTVPFGFVGTLAIFNPILTVLLVTVVVGLVVGGIAGVRYKTASQPQQKKQKAHAELVAALNVGDEVMTAGGILGRITGVSEHYAIVHIAENVEIKIQKASISQVVPKGTFEEA